MQDRYLFRAKRTDTGEWVEGYYALIGNKHVIISKESEGYYTEFVEERHGYEIVNVDPLTACQCTGLIDKNGKLIWENDIVAYYFEKTCAPIYFGSYQSCFDNTKTEHVGFYVNWNDKCNYRKDLGYWINMIEADVVGNIFDNPELLEVEE